MAPAKLHAYNLYCRDQAGELRTLQVAMQSQEEMLASLEAFRREMPQTTRIVPSTPLLVVISNKPASIAS